jgi:C1A family cysteine protease
MKYIGILCGIVGVISNKVNPFLIKDLDLLENTSECEMCVHGVNIIEQELLNNIDQCTIKKSITSMCSLFKNTSESVLCEQLLVSFVEEATKLLKEYAPYEICKELEVCLSETSAQKLEQTHLTEFTKFKKKFKKEYIDIEEYIKRHKIFRYNYDFINSENEKGHNFTLGINHLTDITQEEYRTKHLNKYYNEHYKEKIQCKPQEQVYGNILNGIQYPQILNWEQRGMLGRVRDQSSPRACGSCYDFASIENVQSFHKIHTGESVELSTQEILDFDNKDAGCNGGIPDNVLQYVIENGICDEAQCPYHGVKDGSCDRDSCINKVFIDDCMDVNKMSESSLLKALQNGPVIVAIEADTRYFQLYSGGVLDSSIKCGNNLDHAVLLFGVNLEEKTWSIRNSWSSSWGENGNFRIAMTDDPYGICGLYMDPSQSVIYDKTINI